jgi:hypothetical protein
VTNGAITLDIAASKVQVGLPYEATMQTMRMEQAVGATLGTAQGKTKRASKLVLRVYQTGPGLFYGSDLTTMDEVHFMEDGKLMDMPLGLLDGDTERLSVPSGYSKDGRIAVKHNEPTPAHLVAIMPLFTTQET